MGGTRPPWARDPLGRSNGRSDLKVLDPSKLPPAKLPTQEQLERARRAYFEYGVPLRARLQLELGPYLILLDPRNSWRRRQKAAREIAATMPTKITDRDAYYALKHGEGQQWLREKILDRKSVV